MRGFDVNALGATKGARVDPDAVWRVLAKRYLLIGVQGIVRMAMALLDVACWDALAKEAGVPLAAYLGATPRPIPAYNSCGLGDVVAPLSRSQRTSAGGYADRALAGICGLGQRVSC